MYIPQSSMKNFLVAGGAGFIGSHLCDSLIARGDSVICIDNFITGSKQNIEHHLDNPRFKFIETDIIERVPQIDENIDGIFHLASPASPNQKNDRSYISYPIETLRVNSVGTYNLLLLCKDKSSKFVYASTSEVYGNPAVSPQPETYWGNVNPNGVRSVYDEGKRFGEAMVMAFKRKYSQDTRIMRIFNTYGPRMQPDDGRVVSNFATQALRGENITIYGDGNQTRSFCYVSDLVDGIIRIMDKDGISGEVINLGNPSEFTINALAEMILKFVGSDSKVVFEEKPIDDPERRRPDISKAKEILGWEPKVPLEEGLQKTIEYFKT